MSEDREARRPHLITIGNGEYWSPPNSKRWVILGGIIQHVTGTASVATIVAGSSDYTSQFLGGVHADYANNAHPLGFTLNQFTLGAVLYPLNQGPYLPTEISTPYRIHFVGGTESYMTVWIRQVE